MSVTGQISVAVDLKDQRASDSESASITIARAIAQALVDGAGAGAVNAIWQDTLPLTDGGTVSPDLAPTAASGVSGAVTFARIKVVVVYAPTTNTTNITLSKHASNCPLIATTAAALAPLKPGGFFVFCDPSAAGIAVTATSADILFTATNSAGAAATLVVIVAGALT